MPRRVEEATRGLCALDATSERQGRRIPTSGNGPTVTELSDRRIGISRRKRSGRGERAMTVKLPTTYIEARRALDMGAKRLDF